MMGERGPQGDHGQTGDTGKRGPRGRDYPKRVLIAFGIVVVLAAALVAGMGYYVNQTRDLARQVDQAGKNRGLDSIAGRYFTCLQIEKLKMGEREDANRSFRELPRTLGLLKIKSTPEIVALAKANRDRDLRRYAKSDCVKVAREPQELRVEVPE